MSAFRRNWSSPVIIATVMALLLIPASFAQVKCDGLPSANQLKTYVTNAAKTDTYGAVGGLFGGTRMWAAVVNRSGELCAIVASTADPTQVWPGSNLIAQAKAYTANAFSLDTLALSTARL